MIALKSKHTERFLTDTDQSMKFQLQQPKDIRIILNLTMAEINKSSEVVKERKRISKTLDLLAMIHLN